MKKKYIAPAVGLYEMQIEGMIASSIRLGGKEEKIDTSGAFSQKKGSSIWGE